ncbi:MAG: phenylalanine--tRNA ligase subunit beta [Chloroflexota bacterium]
MRVPLSWLKDYVDITISAEELAERLTLAGLEVGAVEYIGVPQGVAPEGITVPPSDHLVWARDKIVLGKILEVKAHPNADRLVLAMVDYGAPDIEQVVTGAPNLLPYKDKGPLDPPLYSPLALEGSEVYDGHAEGQQRMILKEKSLRGIPNRAMVCSAKELGLGDDHDGILLLEGITAKPGTPLVDLLGDVIFDIELTPNMARAYSIIGVAREVAALTGQSVHEPSYEVVETGAPFKGQLGLTIRNPELNPRFTAMLIKDIEIKPSPQWLQRRLIAVGERPINNIVDITNYVMFETGQPLHAFDYDILLKRSGGKMPTILTRTAKPGEKVTTLDGVEHTLEYFTVLVCDAEGVLSIAGIMGGDESKVLPTTKSVLLEAANWNYINIRRTMFTQKMSSEAGLRFSRGIHPAQCERGLKRAIELMRELGSGTIAQGMMDLYPLPAPVIEVDLPLSEVKRLVGIPFSAENAADILRRLQFNVQINGDVLHVTVPDHRVDIGTGAIGIADLSEELARIYGYDRIPDTLIEDQLPPQQNNESLIREEKARDLLSQAGLREAVNYRLTTPEAEARLIAPGQKSSLPDVEYVTLANPISADKTVMRHTLLNGLLENVANNQRHTQRQMLFEIGSIFLPAANELLPDEPRRLGLVLTGIRDIPGWQAGPAGRKDQDQQLMDFFDLKGVLETLARGLRIGTLSFELAAYSAFHPGRSASVSLRGKQIGFIGELHPSVLEAYDLAQPVIAAELDFDLLTAEIPMVDKIMALVSKPAVYQDIALVVSEQTPASEVQRVIVEAGGALLRAATLFDVYQGDQIPAGKKSLAYALTYQAEDRTLTDKEVAKVHQEIVKASEQRLGAALRG